MNAPLGWLTQCGPRLEKKTLLRTTSLLSNPCIQNNKVSAHSRFNLHTSKCIPFLEGCHESAPSPGIDHQAPHSVFCTKTLSFSFGLGPGNSMTSLLQHFNNKRITSFSNNPFRYHIHLILPPPPYATVFLVSVTKKNMTNPW